MTKYGTRGKSFYLWAESAAKSADGKVAWPEAVQNNSGNIPILVFLKYFDVQKQTLSGVGHIYVKKNDKVADATPQICKLMQWDPSTPLLLFEEIKFSMIELRTACRAIQFDIATTQTLHEKDGFISHTKELGLTVPETHVIKSKEEALAILLSSGKGGDDSKGVRQGKEDMKFIMKPNGVDDASRADMTLLPLSTNYLTQQHISRLNITATNPWILQQFIRGPEFCTHSLVIRGRVAAFTACPSAELLMHYAALTPRSPLWNKMLNFTKTYAEKGGKGFTGHLSFDFLVEREILERNEEDVVLYPIECNPRAHTAVVLFEGVDSLVDAYLSIFDEEHPKDSKDTPNGRENGTSTTSSAADDNIVIPISPYPYYWLPHDLVELVILPVLSFLGLNLFSGPSTTSSSSPTKDPTFLNPTLLLPPLRLFATHVLTWRDGTYLVWDPLPYWWLYHVYWPVRLAMRLASIVVSGGKQGKWSRTNVSTTKMFNC
jgi:catechol O-methyltransferase